MSELKAYQVGDCDVVAAYTPEQAFEVLNEMAGYTQDGVFSFELNDVKLVDDQVLDATMYYDLDEGKTVHLETTLRQDLLVLTEAGYLYGWE